MTIEFSVVIPTFRRPRELLDAVRSALSQQGSNIEVIVIDDSPEGSAEAPIATLADERVRYLRNPNPTGGRPSVVRNLGWPQARGEYVHFLDDDDRVADGYYACVKAAFERNPDVGLVYGRIEPFGSAPSQQMEHELAYFSRADRKSTRCRRFGRRWAYVGRMLFDSALLVCSASVSRRSCVARLGGFDPEIRLMEDAEYHLRAMRECGVLYLNHAAVHYRIGFPSLMHSPDPSPAQVQEELAGRRSMQAKYRARRGSVEFFALALMTRSLLRVF